MPQTTFPEVFPQREGSLAEGPWDAESYVAEGNVKFGLLVGFGTDPRTQVVPMATMPAADDDAIMTTAQFVSNAAGATYETAAEFDGATGHDRVSPAMSVTVTFEAANINDWDNAALGQQVVTIYGLDEDGNPIDDAVARPNGAGAATYTTAKAFSAVTRVDISACAGAGGTGSVGFDPAGRVALGRSDYPGIAIYDPASEPFAAATEVEDEDQVSVLSAGKFWAVCEHAVSNGDDVYVRIAAAGTDVRGQFTGQDGAALPATYAHLSNARWRSAAAAGGLAIIELKG